MDCTTIKAALYIRVSTEEQALEGQSVDAQVETLEQYCQLYNIDIYEIYKDLGVSGKTTKNRSGLQQMLKDASRGKFNMVLVWKISRLSRSLKDLLLILDQLENNNIVFNSYSEKLDTSTAVGRMTLQLLGSIAEFERNTIIDNVKLGLQEYARKGGKTGTVLGYESIGRQLTVNSQEAETVKLIYTLYVLNRMSMSDIAYYLNEKSYKTKRGKKFRKDSISVILSNPVYIGINRHNIGSVDEYQTAGSHQPIISNDIWQTAQKLRQSSKIRRQVKDNQTCFVLSDKVICPSCRCNMLGFSTKSASKTYRYYKCKGCKKLINASAIESKVMEIIYRLLQDNQLIEDTLTIIRETSELTAELAQIQNQIQSCSNQLDKYIYILNRDELKSSNIIIDKVIKLERTLQQLQIERDYLISNNLNADKVFEAADYLNVLEEVFNTNHSKYLKQIINLSVKYITIECDNHSGSIAFTFNIGNSSIVNFVL
ncbi:MAG: recombinase family protein [Lutisporaceae bacterium]